MKALRKMTKKELEKLRKDTLAMIRRAQLRSVKRKRSVRLQPLQGYKMPEPPAPVPHAKLADEFELYLEQKKLKPDTVRIRTIIVRRFLRYVGGGRLDRLSEEVTRGFFVGLKEGNRKSCASAISQFLIFATARLPVVVSNRGAEMPAPSSRKELALRRQWSVDKLIEQKEAALRRSVSF